MTVLLLNTSPASAEHVQAASSHQTAVPSDAHSEAHTETHHKPAIGSWEYVLESNIINVVVVAVFLAIILSKLNLGKAIKGKQAAIIHDIETAQQRQKEAEAQLDALNKRAGSIQQEVASILQQATDNAERLKAQILSDAEAQAEKIRETALKQIAQEEKQRMAETQNRLMTEAVYAAKALLENTLSDDDKRKSVDDFIAELPQFVAGGQA